MAYCPQIGNNNATRTAIMIRATDKMRAVNGAL